MQKFDHLTKTEELQLGELIQKGIKAKEKIKNPRIKTETREKLQTIIFEGEQAVDKLVKANLGLVYSQALYFSKSLAHAPEYEDLVSMGMIGLMVAVEKYDPTRNNKFSTVATWWIRQSLTKQINKTSRLVRLPDHRVGNYSQMLKIEKKLNEDGVKNSETIDVEIMQELDLQSKDLINIRNAAASPASLNKQIGDGDNGKEFIEMIYEKEHISSTEAVSIHNDCIAALFESVSNLDHDPRRIVSAYFSLPFEGEYRKAKEVREEMGLSHAKFKKILNTALANMRTTLEEKGFSLSDFLSE